MSSQARPELTPMPGRIRRLPIDRRGYPIPYFVDYLDGEPEFRSMDPKKWKAAVIEKRCWVCGDHMGRHLAFVIGPMCTITRTTAEPPSHRECAEWSLANCPFLTRPHMVRREDDLTRAAEKRVPGYMIKRNPGAMCLWITQTYRVWRDEPLITVGDPVEVGWSFEGRAATRAEVEESIRTGLPLLEETCEGDEACLKDLHSKAEAMRCWLPKECSEPVA